MKLTLIILAATFVSTWLTLRIFRPDIEIKIRSAALVLFGALGAAIAFALLGTRWKPDAKQPDSDLESTADKYDAQDNFDSLAKRANTLEPPPPPSDLASELEDFRAGASELLEGYDTVD